MRTPLHPCYILHQRNYRETSLLLDVFSRDHGRVGLVARGAKRKRNFPQGIIQPYRRLLISWTGKGELFTVTGMESDSSSLIPLSCQLIAGFYLNELILRLLHRHDAHAELFDAYEDSLMRLGNGYAEQPVLRIFEKRLLQALGYGLVLDHEVQSGLPIEGTREYYYQFDLGPLTSQPESREHIKLSGRTLLSLRDESLTDMDSLGEARHLMRHILRRHLGERPLASRELYKAYLENRQKP